MHVQNLDINLHSQKQWKYVPLSEWHLTHKGEMEWSILCNVSMQPVKNLILGFPMSVTYKRGSD